MPDVSAGFVFDVPIPMPRLGPRYAHGAVFDGRAAHIQVDQLTAPADAQTRMGGLSINGAEHAYHSRDRFGLHSHSRITVRISGSPDDLLGWGVYAAIVSFPLPDGRQAGLIGPSDLGLELCARVVNDLVAAYSVAFASWWVPMITSADLINVRLLAWSGLDAPPTLVGTYAGGPGDHGFRFDVRASAVDADHAAADKAVGRLPFEPWEELVVRACQDIETGRLLAAMMQLGLAFEAYVRRTLTLNLSTAPPTLPEDMSKAGMSSLCTDPRFLPRISGGTSLESVAHHGAAAVAFRRVVAMRNAAMHQASLRYSVRIDGTLDEFDVRDTEDAYAQVTVVEDLIEHVASRVSQSGFQAAWRGRIRPASPAA